MATRGTLAYTAVADLERAVEDYFDGLWKTRKLSTKAADGSTVVWDDRYMDPPTLAGLAYHLDISRQTLLTYKGTDQFGHVLNRAKDRVAVWVEQALYNREAANGARFALEVNHGYGREQGPDVGAQFVQQIVPPSISQTRIAIPKWDEGDE